MYSPCVSVHFVNHRAPILICAARILSWIRLVLRVFSWKDCGLTFWVTTAIAILAFGEMIAPGNLLDDYGQIIGLIVLGPQNMLQHRRWKEVSVGVAPSPSACLKRSTFKAKYVAHLVSLPYYSSRQPLTASSYLLAC